MNLSNAGDEACSFPVADNAYRDGEERTFDVDAGGRTTNAWDIAGEGGWYDLTVRVPTCRPSSAAWRGVSRTARTAPATPAMDS